MPLPGVWVPGSLGISSFQMEYGILHFSNRESSPLYLFNEYILYSYYVPRFVLGAEDGDEKMWSPLVRSSHSG